MPCVIHCFRRETDEGFRFSFSFRKNWSGINLFNPNQRQRSPKRAYEEHSIFKRTREIRKQRSPECEAAAAEAHQKENPPA